LQHRARQAERIPFFARLWADAEVTADDLRSLEDLAKFPLYDVDMLRQSIERCPPWGDYQGVRPADALREPLRVYMSGGTTGKSRPTLYTQWDRDVTSLFAARTLYRYGIRPGDTVINAYQYSTFNGGALFDEALHRWLNCIVISTSSGNVTPSEKQVDLAREYQVTAILTTGDHLLRMAAICDSRGIDIRRDLNIRAIGGLGDRKTPDEIRALLDRFGVDEYYETYGFHEVGLVSVECPEHDGLHIFEEAMTLQIVDPTTREALPDGQLGSMVVTEFFKTGSAQFRYNTLDLASLYPREQCRCGSWMRRMTPFAGRGDNMVKLRGVNIWPEAVGNAALGVPGTADDYFVRVQRTNDRDEMVVSVASPEAPADFARIGAAVETALHNKFGLKIAVEVVRPGELDELTETGRSPKPKRFRDERPIARHHARHQSGK
jgi:phenylacetate-CoA ligase